MRARFTFRLLSTFALASIFLGASGGGPIRAADGDSGSGDSGYGATTADPGIPEGQLSAKLRPLEKDELAVEAAAWIELVKQQAIEVSKKDVGAKKQNEEIEKLEKDAEKSEEASEEVKEKVAEQTEKAQQRASEEKTELVEESMAMRNEEAKLIKKAHIVLDAWEEKGGEPKDERLYLSIVSGIALDVSDAGALWTMAVGWVMSDTGGILWGKNLAMFIVIFLAFVVLSKVASQAMARALRATKQMSDLLREFLVTGTRRVIIILGIVVSVQALGVNTGPVLAVIAGAGFVVAFALQDSLSNFASGIMILLYRPFDVGDVIDTAGVLGKVHSMNLVSTTIRTPDNKTVVVPNNSIWGNVITNATANSERRVDLVFGIGYDDDIAKAQKVLEEIISEHELTLKDPEPVVQLHELADSSVNFVCRPWAKTADYWAVYWDITRTVKERFDKEGLSIPYPQQDVHMHNVK